MRRWSEMALIASVALAVAGCTENSTPKPTGGTSLDRPARPLPPPPPPPSSSATDAVKETPQQPVVVPQAAQPSASPVQPSPQPLTPPAPAPAPSLPAQMPIHLATGVALAQTGPEGTMMMFSVDYEVEGQPNTSGYVWVIERGRGNAAKIAVKLSSKGNLVTPTGVNWRPEDGPFHSHLEDRNGKRLSESIEMLQQGI
jgi:hypothetical protein